ncbi:ornithine cyclodeaminase family protein [Candidatus Bathyarchaeota archaeon]|nr:ornithine cyclodeaminase family protein [Candidatus Bathyarchaeota archaeon]
MVLMLSRSDLEKLLNMKDVMEYVETAFLELQSGTAILPMRATITLAEKHGWIGIMPAYLGRMGSLSTKIVTVFEKNLEKNMPTIMATIILNDSETGAPLAIMDGTLVTAMRTGAVCGVATKYLARKDSKIIGIFGAGVQARTQLMAMCVARDIKRALVHDIVKERAESFASEMSEVLRIPVEACEPRELVVQSDIIVTATTSKIPVFNGNWVKPGTHLNLIGSFKPDVREVDETVIKKAKIVVDQKSAALEEAGDIIIPLKAGIITEKDIYAELGELAAGLKPGRTSDSEITLFKSVGLGIQDCAAAWLAYTRAKEKGVGIEVELFR